MADDDLILDKTNPDEVINEELETINSYFLQQDDLRASIDTAVHIYNFLDEIDLDGPYVLQNNLKNRLKRAKKQSLLLLCEALNELCEGKEE